MTFIVVFAIYRLIMNCNLSSITRYREAILRDFAPNLGFIRRASFALTLKAF